MDKSLILQACRTFIYTSRSITKQNIVKVYNENEYTKISTQQKLMKQLF